MITILDYGLGNILAFRNVYERLNVSVKVARCAADLANSTKIILPGVGAFDHAMDQLEASGMRTTLDQLVLQDNVPVLGICVGMQILAASSEEGSKAGLGWVRGRVRKFAGPNLALPHMGWNDVKPLPSARLFSGMEDDARFYFLHSYYFDCEDPTDVIALCTYDSGFCCALKHKNIYGVQFHPEKSHRWGSRLLKNFAETPKCFDQG